MKLSFGFSWILAVLLLATTAAGAGEPSVNQLYWCGGAAGYSCFAFGPAGSKSFALASGEQVGLGDLDDPGWVKYAENKPGRLFFLKGHKERIVFLAFTTDGKTLASADLKGTVKFWDVGARRERVKAGFETGIAPIFSLGDRLGTNSPAPFAFAPDGGAFAAYHLDEKGKSGELKLWDLTSGKARVLIAHRDLVHAMAFSPDGQTLATGSADHTAMLWNVKTGRKIHTLREHTGPVWAVAFSPDGKTLATEASDRLLKLWDVPGGKDHTSFDVGEEARRLMPRALTFSPDGKTLARFPPGSTSAEFWDLETGKRWATLLRVLNEMRGDSLAFSPDGKWFGAVARSGGSTNYAYMWNVAKLFDEKERKK